MFMEVLEAIMRGQSASVSLTASQRAAIAHSSSVYTVPFQKCWTLVIAEKERMFPVSL
jgi:hypothetical protein